MAGVGRPVSRQMAFAALLALCAQAGDTAPGGRVTVSTAASASISPRHVTPQRRATRGHGRGRQRGRRRLHLHPALPGRPRAGDRSRHLGERHGDTSRQPKVRLKPDTTRRASRGQPLRAQDSEIWVICGGRVGAGEGAQRPDVHGRRAALHRGAHSSLCGERVSIDEPTCAEERRPSAAW